MITKNIETLRNISSNFVGTDAELQNLISTLEFELRATKGIGLSAIQINIPLRVAIIRYHTTKINLYNAIIKSVEQPYIYKGDACLSLPNIVCDTQRYNLVTIINGDGEEIKLSGFLATAALHEIDHFDGVLITDRSKI